MTPKRKRSSRTRTAGRSGSRHGPARRRGAGRGGAKPPARGGTRRRPTRAGVRHVENLLDLARGAAGDERDRRRDQVWQGVRTLELGRNRELFADLVRLDFDFLLSRRFAADVRTLSDLLPQSVVGRAQNGHGWFTDEFGVGLRFPDATLERVLSVLEVDDPNLQALRVRRRRGELVTGLGDWLLARLDEPRLELVSHGRPLLGVDFLAGRTVDTRRFLQGMVLAGHMDDWGYRETAMLQHKRTFAGYPFQIGGGEILIVDREKFELVGLGDTGQTVFMDDQLRTLRDYGVVCNKSGGRFVFPQHDQAYFRRRLGDGICDDLALIWIGAHYGLSGLLGGFVMDAIDTYDKYLLELTWGGYDAWLARRLQNEHLERHGEPLVGDERILDLIHFAAKRNDPPVNLSSSHRRLIQIEAGGAVPTLLNHWRFLQGEPVYDIKLGFSRLPARVFYDCAWRRLQAIGRDLPPPRFHREGDGR